MDNIAGVDLKLLAADCEKSHQKERVEAVKRHIRSLLQKIATQDVAVSRTTGELARAQAILDAYKAEMAKIANGDWSAIQVEALEMKKEKEAGQ